MATWDNVVYTALGLNLMAKLQTGATLEITRAVGGDGHTSADALTALTEITARQALTLSNAVYKGSGQALLPVTLYNRGLTEGYPLRQIGIYATGPDDGEVLMLVAQSEQPDTIPSEADSPDFVTNFSFHIALGNAGRINVSYSLTDMATKADYVAYVEQIEGRLGQPGGIATLDALGNPQRARPSHCTKTLRVANAEPIPHYDDLHNYTTPGIRLQVSTVTTCKSIDNIPEECPGILEVTEFGHLKDIGAAAIMQTYTAINGNNWTVTYDCVTDKWDTWRCGAITPMPIYISTSLSPEGYIVFACDGVTTGAYLFVAQGCYNPGGSGDYRSVYTAIIHVACGYSDNVVMVYIKMVPLLVSYGFTAADVDDAFKVGFERMVDNVRFDNYNKKIYVQAQKSVGEPINWTSSLQKLI